MKQVMVYEPVCIWECWTCQKQFLFATLYPPVLCPFCYDVDSVNFVDNIEEEEWRPTNTEGDAEHGMDGR